MIDLPANPRRGIIALGCLCLMVVSAGILWGFGGALFTLGPIWSNRLLVG
jgi:hypothetical protein